MSYDFVTVASARIEMGTLTLPLTTGSMLIYLKTASDFSDAADYALYDCRNGGSGLYFQMVRYAGDWIGGWYTSGDYRTIAHDDPGVSSGWKALILTWSTSTNTSRLYYNGTQIDAWTVGCVTWNTNTKPAYFGNYDQADGGLSFVNAFRGRLAQLCIWNVVLSSGQVTALSNGTECPQNISGREHHWPLISDALDIVGTQHGTVVGATLQSSDNPTLTCSGGAAGTGKGSLSLLGVG